jgi:pimeloyl-ACP methyl ester carboxylesterase
MLLVAVMAHWGEYFFRDADLPVIGASAEALGSITVPACIIHGNHRTHPRRVGEQASRLLPNSELHILMPEEVEADVASEGWDEKLGEVASISIGFLNGVSIASTA